jgi:hypothetical protein
MPNSPTLVSAHPYAPNRIRSSNPSRLLRCVTVLHHDRAVTVVHGSTATVLLWYSPWRLGAGRPCHVPFMSSLPSRNHHLSLCAPPPKSATVPQLSSIASEHPPVIPPALCSVCRAAPTLPSVCRWPAPCIRRVLHWWTSHADKPLFAQVTKRCYAQSACCKRIFLVFYTKSYPVLYIPLYQGLISKCFT